MPAFSLGRLLTTPGAIAALDAVGLTPLHFIVRHARGDWGQLDAHDKRANEHALKSGARLLSAYLVPAPVCPECGARHHGAPVGATVPCACGGRVALVGDDHTGFRLYVITEAADDAGQRVATTVLLPEEY